MKDLHSMFAGFKTKPQYLTNPEVKAVVDAAESAIGSLDENAPDYLQRIDSLIKDLKKDISEIVQDKKSGSKSLQGSSEAKESSEVDEYHEDYKDCIAAIWKLLWAEPDEWEIKMENGKVEKAPTWDEIRDSITPEVLEEIKKLENPRLMVIPRGMELKAAMNKAQEGSGLKFSSYPAFEEFKNSEIVLDPKQFVKVGHGGTKKSDEKCISWEVRFVDGGDEVPAQTIKKSPTELRNQSEGIDSITYLLLQVIGKFRGKPFDRSTLCWFLNEYSPSLQPDRLSGGNWISNGSALSFFVGNPTETYDRFGARRSVKVPLKRIKETGSPESLEKKMEILANLESQYSKRVETLEYFELFDRGTREITAIDGNRYPMPSWNEIWSNITPDRLDKIQKHIPNPHLLVVPIGMPLDIIAQKIISKPGKLQKYMPNVKGAGAIMSASDYLLADNYDITADIPKPEKNDANTLLYFPGWNGNEDEGITKTELLGMIDGPNRFPGWQVLVVSGDGSVPKDTIGKSPKNLRKEFEANHLSGITPEEWFLLHGDKVREGINIDIINEGSTCWDLGAYFKELNCIPTSCWSPDIHTPRLNYGSSGVTSKHLGARPAVRIL